MSMRTQSVEPLLVAPRPAIAHATRSTHRSNKVRRRMLNAMPPVGVPGRLLRKFGSIILERWRLRMGRQTSP